VARDNPLFRGAGELISEEGGVKGEARQTGGSDASDLSRNRGEVWTFAFPTRALSLGERETAWPAFCSQNILGSRSPLRMFPLPGRNDSVEIGERDRPGRSSRRPADWLSAPRNPPNGASSRGNNGLRRDAENSGRDARAPQSN